MYNLKRVELPNPTMIINSKQRFNLFAPTTTGTRGEILAGLRRINKIRDVSVIAFNYINDRTTVKLLIIEGHTVYTNINIFSKLGRDVDYRYLPITVELNENHKLDSVGIEISYKESSSMEADVHLLKQIESILKEVA